MDEERQGAVGEKSRGESEGPSGLGTQGRHRRHFAARSLETDFIVLYLATVKVLSHAADVYENSLT